MGSLATHFDGGAIPALRFGGEERAEHIGRIPALGPSSQHHLFYLLAHVFEAQPPTQGDHLVDGDRSALTHDPASVLGVL